jgi:hypothetical protein
MAPHCRFFRRGKEQLAGNRAAAWCADISKFQASVMARQAEQLTGRDEFFAALTVSA